MSVTSANRLELLQIADAVAREKMIDPSLVIEAMEDSLGKAARSRYGAEYDIRAVIDRKSGELALTRYRHVVEEPENLFTELTLDEARRIKPDAELDDYLTDPLPPVDFGRIAAQSAKQVIMQKVREAERLRQYEEFKDRQGEIINGIVKRTEYGNVIVDVGRGEAILRRDQLIQREAFRNGDRVRALIREVRHETRGPQIFLSRTAPEFLAELFKMEVPEIYDNIIEIKAVARDPGSRAKMGVISYDSSIDPVGACVGMRGSRVQAVVNELQGEKIDIIPWNQDPATFLVNALQPAEVSKVVFDDDSERIEVVVPDEQLSLAIGRRGQNVRLASQLTGFDIDILTDAQESERRQAEFAERTQLFMETMNVDEMVAQLLVAEGFSTLEEVAYVDTDELTSIDGFDQNTAEELQARARESLDEINAKAIEHAKELGVEQSLFDFEGLTPQMFEALAVDGIKTLEDFATVADWELAGGYTTVDGKRVKDEGLLEKFDMSLEEAQTLIMSARVQLGWVDPADLAPAEAEEEAGESPETGESIETGEAPEIGKSLGTGEAEERA
jgi:transcription termination/antitermination protein NusA